jgi:uncharacterized protein YyaL (SSP411 family)
MEPEAFEETKQRRNVLSLLSVGYAACHWCHLFGTALTSRQLGLIRA